MMLKNEEGVLRRLEMLRRRIASLKAVLRQLVGEIEEERKNCGESSKKDDVLRDRLRRLFDADVRFRNLARNFKRKKNLQRNVFEDETSDEGGFSEKCGDDSEFDPSKVAVGQHDPPMITVFPLPHSKAMRPIVWTVGWPMPCKRRDHIDGQFADADFKSGSWVCSSPACKNVFYPARPTRDDIRDHLDLKCWSCGYKAFSEVEAAAHHEQNQPAEIEVDEPNVPKEIKVEELNLLTEIKVDEPNMSKEIKVEDYSQSKDVLKPDEYLLEDENKVSGSGGQLDQVKGTLQHATGVPSNRLKTEKVPQPAFTKIKHLPLNSNQSFVKKKSVKMGHLDINSNIANKRGGSKLVKSEYVKPFSTRPVCTCSHPHSSSQPSKGACSFHPTNQINFPHASKSTSAVSLKESSMRLRQQKSQTHSGSSLQRYKSRSSTSSFPGCTCPSFHDKSKEEICQVHPNLHHLRQPTLQPAVLRRKRIVK